MISLQDVIEVAVISHAALPMLATHEIRLVVLSILIAVVASYTAIDLAGRVTEAQKATHKWIPRLWLAAGALSMGIGIWSMHFIAMLAYHLPLLINYNPSIVLVSMLVAIVASGAALFVVSRQQMGWLQFLAGGIFMGLGVASMHYTGMAAMRLEAIADYDPKLVVLSVMIGIGASLAALRLAFHFRAETTEHPLGRENLRKLGGAMLMGNAIAGMHYTAMVAVSFKPVDLIVDPQVVTSVQPLPPIDTTLLAVAVGFAAFTILSLTLLTSHFDRRISAEAISRAEALRESEERFRLLVEGVKDYGIFMLDLEGYIVSWNAGAEGFKGYWAEEIIGQHLSYFYTNEDIQQGQPERALEMATMVGRFEEEGWHIRRDGSQFWANVILTALRDEKGSLRGFSKVIRDITERKQAEEQLLYNAFHDALTGLPNRILFMDRLGQALKHGKRHENYLFAVLFLDLDRFKVINDSLGHTLGDQLLIAIARRLEACLRPTDTVARLGGDEFTILLERIEDVSDAIRIAERIQAELTLPFELSGQEVFTGASIGIALSATDYRRSEDLLRDADIAMYQAKSLGKGRYELFNTGMHARAVALLQLETDLRRAIERQEFRIYYQPIVSLSTGRITGFEALIRWQHPERGLVFPEAFISVAEETGLIIPIDQWVLREACHQLRQWQEQFPPEPTELASAHPLTISVNLCNLQFKQPELIKHINGVLQEAKLDAHSLKLEITENIIMKNDESATATLSQLRNLGAQLSIDDFGTGYSSLSRLHHFPIDILKIDRSFVSKIGTDEGNLELTETIVTLAQKLRMEVTAEGVETAEQFVQLRGLNCEYGQGYFFSKPLDTKAAEALMMAKPQW